jgi:hypothetical protein
LTPLENSENFFESLRGIIKMKPHIMPIAIGIICLGFIFGENTFAAENAENNTQNFFSLSSLIAPLGAATLSFVSATFLTGLFRRKLGRRFLKLHLYLAVISIVLGLTHGILVFILLG